MASARSAAATVAGSRAAVQLSDFGVSVRNERAGGTARQYEPDMVDT